MTKIWIGILAGLALPALSLAQTSDAHFRQLALLVIEQRLEQSEKAGLSGVLNQICQETHLPDAEARKRLVGLLDSLEAQRRDKGPAWKSLLNLGKREGPPKRTEKFLRQLSDSFRKALLGPADRKGGDYELKELVANAEQSAQFLPGQGKELLLQMLSQGSECIVPRLAGVPQQVSLLVELQITPIEVVSTAVAPPTIGTGTQAKLPDLAGHLLPSLIQDLPASPRIRSAAGESAAQPQPDYRLMVTLENLQDSYSGGSRQEITLTAQLALVSLKDEVRVYQRPMIIKRYTSTGKILDPLSAEFCTEVATKIRHALNAYLSAR